MLTRAAFCAGMSSNTCPNSEHRGMTVLGFCLNTVTWCAPGSRLRRRFAELPSFEVRRLQAHVSLPPTRGFRAPKAPDRGDEQAGDPIERSSSDPTCKGTALGARHRSALVESRGYLSVPPEPTLPVIMRDAEGGGDSPPASAFLVVE